MHGQLAAQELACSWICLAVKGLVCIDGLVEHEAAMHLPWVYGSKGSQCVSARWPITSGVLLIQLPGWDERVSHLYLLDPPPCSCSLTFAVSRGRVSACIA